MQVNIRQNGTNLPHLKHEGQTWVLAPPEGAYEVVLYNNCSRRRLAVTTVDGMSVMDGTPGKRDGNGYVLEPWQTLVIPGWRRSASEVARFEFTPNEGSYSNQTGKGTRNTGVIAVVVFEEKAKPQVIVNYPPPVVIREVYPPWWPGVPNYPWVRPGIYCGTTLIGSSTTVTTNAVADASASVQINSAQCSFTASASAGEPLLATASAGQDSVAKGLDMESLDLGTGYGQRAEMRTTSTTFERASKKPALEVVIRYGVRERLAKLGVPVEQAVAAPVVPTPDPFPGTSCPAPPGWGG
jgi:hypothetical protein